MKRLEGEVINEFTSYGGSFKLEGEQITIDPHQFLGLETNPRAAHIAEMVLWIGYLQWHYQTHGNVSPPEPIIKRFKNIQHRDAILDWSSIEGAVDKNGVSLTRWDRVTFKKHPATGQDVPDESAQEQDEVYEEPKPAQWPEADFIVGNPPFVGNKVRRFALGSGYVDALTRAYPCLPESCDLVMYWWHKAAELVQKKKVRQFGLITTNSITQVFNRRVTAPFLEKKDGCHLLFAIPDHPWVDAKDGAAVRIAMTAGACGEGEGTLATVIEERETDNRERSVVLSEQRGVIHADLTVGADVSSAKPLKANAGLACRGVIPVGKGFIITHDEATALGLGKIPGLEKHIRPYRNGNDITDKPRGVMAIDLLGLEEDEVRARYPEVYQWLLERVKPERDAKSAQSKDYAIFAKRWWLFGKPRETLRPALRGLTQDIITVYVAKHRFFLFCNKDILPDDGLVAIASNDAYHLGVLSSKIHVCWALAAGGRLGVGNDPRYNKTVCFDPFPFPPATGAQKEKIRALAERLHEHRASRQALHPSLTLTGMYNVLEALREGRELKAQERTINEQGLIGILKEIHDQLDAAVAEAYGWPANLGEQDILSRLVALNAERVEEEKEGKIRYLRPDYQNPSAKRLEIALSLGTLTGKTKTSKRRTTSKVAWPSDMPSQVNSVRLNVNVRETHSMLLDVLSEQHEQHQDLFNSNRLTFSEALAKLYQRLNPQIDMGQRTPQTIGEELLDYRNYLEMEVEVNRGSDGWLRAESGALSTGEAIGTGMSILVMVVQSWEDESRRLRGKDISPCRLLFLDEAARLDARSIATLFELCERLEMQLIIAAPENISPEKGTTYKLVRKVFNNHEHVHVVGLRGFAAPLPEALPGTADAS